jgi:CBS-domain-containing membrane protein
MKEDRLDAPVRDCMVSAVRTLSQEQSLTAAARELEQLGMSALPVVERSGRLTGLLGWAELRGAGRLLSRAEEPRGQLRLPEGTVAQFMSSSVPVISREASIALAARRMYERGLKRLYVAEDGPLEGVLSTRELLRVVQLSPRSMRVSRWLPRLRCGAQSLSMARAASRRRPTVHAAMQSR